MGESDLWSLSSSLPSLFTLFSHFCIHRIHFVVQFGYVLWSLIFKIFFSRISWPAFEGRYREPYLLIRHYCSGDSAPSVSVDLRSLIFCATLIFDLPVASPHRLLRPSPRILTQSADRPGHWPNQYPSRCYRNTRTSCRDHGWSRRHRHSHH